MNKKKREGQEKKERERNLGLLLVINPERGISLEAISRRLAIKKKKKKKKKN